MAIVRVVEGVEDGSDAHRLISGWVGEAADALGCQDEIRVYVWGGLNPPSEGRIAGANASEISFHSTLLYNALLGRKENLRLGYYAYEEVAHFLLHRKGVPGDGVGVFFQELFACWAQHQHMVITGRIPESWMETWPVSGDKDFLYYELGKHLGSAIAGSEPNRRHLHRWKDAAGETEAAELVRFAEERLAPPLTASAVAEAYREWMSQ